jgi:hypothetical protein
LVADSERLPLSARDYLRSTSPQPWSVVRKDPRFPTLEKAIGIPNLGAALPVSPAAQEAWNLYENRVAAAAIDSAVIGPFRSSFPSAAVGLSRAPVLEYADFDARRVMDAGTSGNVAFVRLPSPPTGDLATLGQISTTLATVNPAMRVLAVVAAPVGGGSDATAIASWAESLRHACAMTGAVLMGTGGTGQTIDLARSIASEARAAGVGVSRALPAHRPNFDPSSMAISGAQFESAVIWRVTLGPGWGAARVRFIDGSSQIVSPSAGSSGLWLSHPSSKRISAIDALPATTDPRAKPPVLFDTSYSPSFSASVQDAERYLIVYQPAVDPESMRTGRVDTARVLAAVDEQIRTGGTYRWGVLDFEAPFDDVFEAGPGHPLYATAVGSLVDTIRAVKQRFPSINWTYFNFPRVRYWVSGKDWASLTPSQRIEAMHRALNSYAPLMAELDWFNPNVYDWYESQQGMPPCASPAEAERAFRTASVELIRRWFTARGNSAARPIIPMVSPWFQPGGAATVLREIPVDEFIADQVQPCIDAGADSVAIWGCMQYFLNVALMPQDKVPAWAMVDRAQMRSALSLDIGVAIPDTTLGEASSLAVRQLAQDRLDAALNEGMRRIQMLGQLASQ